MSGATGANGRRRPPAASRGEWIPHLLILGAFTPYFGLALDIRWEHLFAYSAAVLIVFNGRVTSTGTLRGARQVLTPWLILAALVTTSTAIRLADVTGSFPTVRLLALVDSFLLPVALVLVSSVFAAVDPMRWKRQMRRAVGFIVVLISLNSLLIVLFSVDQVDGFIRQFWANPTTLGPRGSVAERALLGGRYGGIFNQPFDGGLTYALALMGWSYLFIIDPRPSPRRWLGGLISLALLLAGGVSTGSKVFVYGSVLVVAMSVLPDRGATRSRLERAVRGAAVASFGVAAVTATELAVFERYLRILGAFGSDSTTLSGGRWSSVSEYVGDVVESVSIAGRGWQGPQDDALIAYLQGGGVLGLVAIVAVFRAIFTLCSRLPRRGAERAVLIGMTVVMLGASFGAISLQVNRASSIYWIMVGLAVGHQAKRGRRSSGANTDRADRDQVRSGQFAATSRSR